MTDAAPHKVGDLVCRTDLFNRYFIVNRKISRVAFNMMVGTVIATNGTTSTVRLLNDSIVYASRGSYMKFDSRMAESIQFDE